MSQAMLLCLLWIACVEGGVDKADANNKFSERDAAARDSFDRFATHLESKDVV